MNMSLYPICIFVILSAALLHTVTGSCSLEEFVSEPSGNGNDDVVFIACPSGYTVFSCECRHLEANGCDGATIDVANNGCTAFNSGYATTGPRAVAYCQGPDSDVTASLVTSGNTVNAAVSCPANSEMLACWYHSYWSPSYGYPHAVITGNSCAASTPCDVGSQYCRLEAQCQDSSRHCKPCKCCVSGDPILRNCNGAKSQINATGTGEVTLAEIDDVNNTCNLVVRLLLVAHDPSFPNRLSIHSMSGSFSGYSFEMVGTTLLIDNVAPSSSNPDYTVISNANNLELLLAQCGVRLEFGTSRKRACVYRLEGALCSTGGECYPAQCTAEDIINT